MRYSRIFPKTHKQVPQDIQSVSHKLLLQAGYIRSVGQGLFSFAPLGMRVVRNLKRVIHQEMQSLGGLEVMTPLVNPIDLWRASGRDQMVHQDMIRFTDRAGRQLVLAPTHEEAMVALMHHGLHSYRDLPVFFYQFQLKFRDEERTRCGLVRTREFIMKDGYSFHRSFTDLNNFFPRVFAAYRRVFDRCNVPVIAAEAGVGYMGGERSYEFLMPCECGDDHLIQCDSCGYAANADVAVCAKQSVQENPAPITQKAMPKSKSKSMSHLARKLKIPKDKLVKPILLATSGKGYVMAVVRSDHEFSIEKLNRVVADPVVGFAPKSAFDELGLSAPYLSPIGLPEEAAKQIMVVVDDGLAETANMICAGNDTDFYYENVNFGRDFDADQVADIIRVPQGMSCLHCNTGTLHRVRAMELGNVFRLGDYYTRRMNVSFDEENGRLVFPYMGSYGIGVGRLMAAIVEANHDNRGMIWPAEISPFKVFLMSIGKSLSVRDRVEEIHREFEEITLLDDRRESIGRKLRDADLLGIPIRIVVSRNSVDEDTIEVTDRRTKTTQTVPRSELRETIAELADVNL